MRDRRFSDLKVERGMVYRTLGVAPDGPPNLLIYRPDGQHGWGVAHATLRIVYCLPSRLLRLQDAKDIARAIIDVPESQRESVIAAWWQSRIVGREAMR
jgi:hypothetical protein